MGSFTRRRGLALGLGLALPAPAAAAWPPTTPRAPMPAVALPLPPPCAGRPGDIAGLILEGPSAAAVVVFGQAFRPGDLPRGAGLACRQADGRALPLQFDVKVRHPDGSARFGIVSLAAPLLRRGERLGIVLHRGAGPDASALDFAAASAGRQAAVEITPLVQGAPWRVDLLAAMASRREAEPWQAGPLAIQQRLALEVPPAATGGATSLRLLADVSLRADGSLWVDLWLRNDTAMRPGGGEAAYGVKLTLDGREVLTATLPRHFQYQGYGRLRGVGRGGGAPPATAFVRHNFGYLADAAALPRYDQSTGVDLRRLDELERLRADPAWDVPLAPRRITTAMGAGGGRPDIGPVTGFQAAWLCSGDPRAAAFALDQAEAAGAIPWHHWDPGRRGREAAWLNTRDWPRIWSDSRGGAPPGGLQQHVSRDTGWQPTPSHQPDLSYVPYLLTGRRAFLDGLLAQGAWSIVTRWPARRSSPTPGAPLDDVIVLLDDQVRTYAWSMRQIENAAWIAPEGDRTADYLRAAATTNWLWFRSRLASWTSIQGEPHGWIPSVHTGGKSVSPWQQDYFASTLAMAARRGNADAMRCLEWMSNFLVGRFYAEPRGFPRRDGVAYRIVMFDSTAATRQPLRHWSAVGEATAAEGWSNGTEWRNSHGDFPRWGLQSLAQIAETLRDRRAREAFDWLTDAGAPETSPGIHAANMQLNIVPPDRPRVPASALRCAT